MVLGNGIDNLNILPQSVCSSTYKHHKIMLSNLAAFNRSKVYKSKMVKNRITVFASLIHKNDTILSKKNLKLNRIKCQNHS